MLLAFHTYRIILLERRTLPFDHFGRLIPFSSQVSSSICFLNLQNKPPDWQDFVGIITLLLINSTISFIEENNAGNAAAALMARLAPKAKVWIVMMENDGAYLPT